MAICILADSGFFKNFLYQGGVNSTVSGVLEDLTFKILEGSDQNWSCPESALLAVSTGQTGADSGQLQFWSEPSKILNVRSSSTPEHVVFTIPWY